jgi:hypothetical protein
VRWWTYLITLYNESFSNKSSSYYALNAFSIKTDSLIHKHPLYSCEIDVRSLAKLRGE